MYFARKKSKSGSTLQLLESYRNAEGKPRHRVIASLGDADLPKALWGVVSDAVASRLAGQQTLFDLDPEAAEWVDRILQRIDARKERRRVRRPEHLDGVIVDQVKHTRHASLGPELLGLHAWDTLGMPDLLDGLGFPRSQRDAAAASVINRLSCPVSENALAKWVRRSSLPDLLGEHLMGVCRDRFYRVSDRLLAHREQIEEHLRKAQARHFGLERTLVLYDVTNSHFEGACRRNRKARRGANKQKRSDCVQIAVGIVFDEYGFPLAHKTFEGNRNDATTLAEMVSDLDKMTSRDEALCSLRPPTVIVDAGIATEANLKELRRRGYAYLVNETRKNREKYREEFARDELFEPVPDRDGRTSVRVRRIRTVLPGPGGEYEYVVLCKSAERRTKELAIRSQAEERFLQDIRKLTVRVRKGRLKDPDKIAEAVGRLRQRNSRVSGFYEIQFDPVLPVDEGGRRPRSELKWRRREAHFRQFRGILGGF